MPPTAHYLHSDGLIPSSASGTISNTATVTGPVGLNDPNLANNSATDDSTITFKADLNVTVTDAGAVAGARETLTIVVSNPGRVTSPARWWPTISLPFLPT